MGTEREMGWNEPSDPQTISNLLSFTQATLGIVVKTYFVSQTLPYGRDVINLCCVARPMFITHCAPFAGGTLGAKYVKSPRLLTCSPTPLPSLKPQAMVYKLVLDVNLAPSPNTSKGIAREIQSSLKNVCWDISHPPPGGFLGPLPGSRK